MGYSIRTIVLIACVLLLGAVAFAHSGGTNANGCHTNRKTGDYHCHNAKRPAPGRVNYCHVLNGEYRCGYAKSTCDELKRKFGGSCVRE